ncbi:MAG: ABC transporter family substrate-binding protein [Vicinamibacterales bacterium]
MTQTARNGAAALLVALVAIAAAGCRGGGGNAPAPATARPGTTENQINALARDRVQDGGTVTWVLDSMPPTFNYNHIDGTLLDNHKVIAALLPSPFRTNAGGAPLWNADILASEPTLVTDPKQVVTFRINPKAIWYDGNPITWQDFQAQWQALNGTNKALQISSSNGYADIESVARGGDDREVVVTFAHRYADWQATFDPLYPASTNRDPKVFNDGWKTPLTTAGPFKFESLDQTSKTITLVRNEKWWGAPAKLDRLVFRTMEHVAQIDAVANGEIDFMDIGPDANIYNRARGLSGLQIRTAGGPNFRHLTINGTSPNLQDVRVRRALAKAIDRGAIARALLGPLGVQTEPLNNHIYMANQTGYRDNSGDTGRFEPERSKQLLDEAGWRLDGTVRKKDGRPLEITMIIPSGVPTSRQESELIQNMLAQVGVSLRISVVPGTDFFDKYVRPGQFDFTLFSWMGTPFPISSSQSIYAKPTHDAKGQLVIQQNYSRVGSDEIDALYAQANAELDRQKAAELANRLDALIWDEVHSVTLYQRPELWACKTALANVGAFGFAQPPVYQDIGWAKP